MRATFRQLETFVQICAAGSFSSTAEHMKISQVAVSKHMRALEKAVGGALFVRKSGAKAKINARGELLLAMAPELLKRARDVDQRLHEDDLTVRVRIAADDVILSTLFYPAVSRFYASHRNIQLEFIAAEPTAAAVLAMPATHIDLAYLTLLEPVKSLRGELLAISSGALFASPKIPGIRKWKNDSTQPLPMIFGLTGSAIEVAMRRSLRQMGISNFRVTTNVQHEDTMRELAISGLGCCFLSRYRAAAAIETGKLIEIGAPPAEMLSRLVFRNPQSHGPKVNIVEQYLSGLVRERAQAW